MQRKQGGIRKERRIKKEGGIKEIMKKGNRGRKEEGKKAEKARGNKE